MDIEEVDGNMIYIDMNEWLLSRLALDVTAFYYLQHPSSRLVDGALFAQMITFESLSQRLSFYLILGERERERVGEFRPYTRKLRLLKII